MAKLLKLRRGSTSQHSSFTGAEGEVTIDTTKDTAVVHDGSQAGGRPLAREDMSNVSSASIAGRLGTDSIAVGKIAAGTLPSDVKITDSNVSGNLTIANADINADAVNGSKIADDSIDSEHYVDGSIDEAHIADNQVTFSKLQNIYTQTIMGRLSSGTGDPTMLNASDVRTIINVENGATADQTKSDIDALNINADQVDGLHASSFVRSDQGDTMNGAYTINTTTNEHLILQGSNDPYIRWKEGTTNKAYMQWNANGYIELYNQETNEGVRIKSGSSGLKFLVDGTEKTVWHSGNQGSGSGLDADKLDGVQGSSFLRSDTADTASGDITFTGGAGAVTVGGNSDIRLGNGNWTGDYGAKIQHHSNWLYIQGGSNGTRIRQANGNTSCLFDSSGNLTATGNVTAYSDARLKTDIHTINDALGICGKLRGVSYKWIKDGKEAIGVIAQEVEEVIPSVVLTNVSTDPSTGETTEVKSVDYGKIVGVLINAINELKAEVDELKGGK
jgi:hypothetical protein